MNYENINVAVNCHHIYKKYGNTFALQDMTVSIPSGGIVGILGPNGSGKSTLFRMLANFIQPDEGKMSVLNRMPSWQTNEDIAYLPDRAGWFPEHTVGQAFDWGSRFLPGFERAEASRLADMMEVDENLPTAGMSRGQEARLMMVMCIARRVPLIILDEPFAGIDIISRDRIISGLIDYMSDRKEQTVLISTHEINETESLFDYVVFLGHGQVKLAGESDELRKEYGSMEALFRKLYE